MSKLFKSLLLLTFTFLLAIAFTTPIMASSPWFRNNEPVLSSQNAHLILASVLYSNSSYKAFYAKSAGGWNLASSTSIDGIHWGNEEIDSLEPGSEDGWEKEISDPFVSKINDQYQMWYTSTNTDHWVEGNDRFRTRSAYSTDGISWLKEDNWSLEGDIGNWDAGGTSRGRTVLYLNGKYHMWYSATNSNSLSSLPYWRIGYATSNDGKNWEKKNDSKPVIEPTVDWELSNVSYPNVIYDQGKFRMWYATGNYDLPTRLVYAESTDGIHWTKPADQNPVLTTSGTGFDSVYVASPFVIKDGGTLKMWYSGFDGNKWSIGYATSSEATTNTVPLLKQTSEPWQGLEYDSANIWSPENTTINRWGCALTSAAMVLQYYNYTKLPDGTELNPGTLNDWLKNQPDGYVGNGLVNWLAISRLSKKAVTQNNITNFDALEFSRTGYNTTTLDNDLANNHPAILSVPGHFVVATAKQNATYAINDPFYNRTTLDSGYNNTFSASNRFIPSHTDLSYLMMAVPTSVDVLITNSENQPVQQEYIESAIQAAGIQNVSSGDDLKVVTVQKPTTGTYTITINNSDQSIYSYPLYIYDNLGDVKKETLQGYTNKSTFTLSFDKENEQNVSIEKLVTFDTLLNELQVAYQNKLIRNGEYQASMAILKSAKRDAQKNKIFVAKIKLQPVKLLFSITRKASIEENFRHAFLQDLNTLSQSL